MKNRYFLLIVCMIVMSLMAACSSEAPLTDGTYTGTSTVDDMGGYGVVTIVVENGEIADCTYVTYDDKGDVKDENYGKSSGSDEFYKKAQIAVAAINDYPVQLKEKKQLELVEAVSGATISYNQFQEAVQVALEETK